MSETEDKLEKVSLRIHCSCGTTHNTWSMLQLYNYMVNVNNRNTRTRCEICSKLIIKAPERCQWLRSGVFIVNFEHISHVVLMFLLLTLSR